MIKTEAACRRLSVLELYFTAPGLDFFSFSLVLQPVFVDGHVALDLRLVLQQLGLGRQLGDVLRRGSPQLDVLVPLLRQHVAQRAVLRQPAMKSGLAAPENVNQGDKNATLQR